MNLTRYSKQGIALLLAVLLVGAAGTAAAASFSEDSVPTEKEVGTEATATVTVGDLYDDGPSEWTLRVESEFNGTVDWQVSKKKFGNAGIENESGTGSSYETSVSRDADIESVTVTVTGTVPDQPNSTYSYEPRQNVSAVTVYRVSDGEAVEIDSADVEYYTATSKNARAAIDDAQAAIDEAGGDAEAADTLESAISSYDNGNFANAERLASNAQEQANETQQSQQTTQLLMYGGVGAVVLLVVGGGVWYWRNQQDDYDKLR